MKREQHSEFVEYLPKSTADAAALERSTRAAAAAQRGDPAQQHDSYIDDFGEVGAPLSAAEAAALVADDGSTVAALQPRGGTPPPGTSAAAAPRISSANARWIPARGRAASPARGSRAASPARSAATTHISTSPLAAAASSSKQHPERQRLPPKPVYQRK